jgi:integrase
MRAAKANRHGHRDATMVLIAFSHGLRTAELVDLRWDQVDLGRNACLHVRRVKSGMPSVHPLQGDEMRALRALKRKSSFVFVSERGALFTKAGFAKMVARAGREKRGLSSAYTPTCCAMRVATRWRTGATTRARCKRTSATKIFSTRCDIRNCRQRVSKTFGEPRAAR